MHLALKNLNKRNVWRDQMGNQKPLTEEGQTTQWWKRKSTKRTNNDLQNIAQKTNDRATRTPHPTKDGGELKCCVRGGFIVFNISATSGGSVILVEYTELPGVHHRPAATLVVIGTDCIGNYKSNYQTRSRSRHHRFEKVSSYYSTCDASQTFISS